MNKNKNKNEINDYMNKINSDINNKLKNDKNNNINNHNIENINNFNNNIIHNNKIHDNKIRIEKNNIKNANILQKINKDELNPNNISKNINNKNQNNIIDNNDNQNIFNINFNIAINNNDRNNNISNNLIKTDSKNNNIQFPSNQQPNNNTNNNNNQFVQNINIPKDISSNKKNKDSKESKGNKYSFSRYKKAALTGLINLGNTSYLNAVLQVLCSIRSFASHFLNPEISNIFKSDIQNYKLSFDFHELCMHLYPYPEGEKKIYKPENLYNTLSSYNCAYKNFKENNPNYLIIFLLNKLHEELNEAKNNLSNYNFNNYYNMNIAIYKYGVIVNGIKNFITTNDSIISNLFNWFEITENKCTKCSNNFYSFQSFSTFDLNISNYIKYKKESNIKLEDCLDYYTIPRIIKKFCKCCNQYFENITTKTIYSSPNIFIFFLDSLLDSDNNSLKNVNFLLEKRINLIKFIENKLSPYNYELIGIIIHDINNNKYLAYCASPVDKNWYLYNDQNVNLLNFDEFIDIYNNRTDLKPYILLYQFIKE